MIQSRLQGLIAQRSEGNLAFVHHFYAICRHQSALFVNCRGTSLRHAINRHTIRTHLEIPLAERNHYARLMSDFPEDAIVQTLCLPGKGWHVPRKAEMYIRRSECRPETKPFIHLVCNNILPTSHLANLTKRQALCIYMLMQGICFDISTLIYTSLEDAVLTTKTTKAIVFPHLISDMFTELDIPVEPTDRPFAPVPMFIYERIRGPPPPQPEPVIDIDDILAEEQEAPAPQAPDVRPPSPAALASFIEEFRQFRASFDRERRYRRRMDALIAQSLRFDLPIEEDEDSGAETSGAGPSGVGGAEEGTQEGDAAAAVDSEGDSEMRGGD